MKMNKMTKAPQKTLTTIKKFSQTGTKRDTFLFIEFLTTY